ncbi:MAG: hypothetical protein F6K47_19360 [Symploca sp. SIO2E6]|nr:hypothetical protein [Symploca sp. SIO2E6]
MEPWLAGSLGRTDLAQQTRQITNDYDTKRRKGLELFVRQMCLEAEIEPYPELFTQPSRLDTALCAVMKYTFLKVPLIKGDLGGSTMYRITEQTAVLVLFPLELNNAFL